MKEGNFVTLQDLEEKGNSISDYTMDDFRRSVALLKDKLKEEKTDS
jgi:hypothetical protein